MANVHVLSIDRIKNATLSGGSWETTLPLNNIKNQQPTKIARSTDELVASTQFKADIGRLLPVSMFALINHNGTADGTARFRLSENADLSSPSIDETVDLLRPNVVLGSMPWGEFPWDGLDINDVPTGGWVTLYNHPATEYGRYIGVNVDDEDNPDGYFQLGVAMAGAPFVPGINMALGAGLSFVDPSRQTRTIGGQKYTDRKPVYRTFGCALEFASEIEAWGVHYDMQRLLGISGPLLLVYDPDDDDDIILRRTIYGTLQQLDRIVTARVGDDKMYSISIQVEELI